MRCHYKLIVFCGPPCSGKTTGSKAFCITHSIPRLEMDEFRLKLYPNGPHDAPTRRLSYDAMHTEAARLIADGTAVVALDATYQPRLQRRAVQQIANKFDASVLLLQFQVSPDEAAARFASRDKSHAATDLSAERVRDLAAQYHYGASRPISSLGCISDLVSEIEARCGNDKEAAASDQELVSWVDAAPPSTFELEQIRLS